MSLTGVVFIGCFALGLLLALFRHPAIGLYTYLAVFYLDPPSRWWGSSLPEIRWSLVAAAVTIIAAARLPPPEHPRAAWYSTTPAKILILFTAWFWLQNLWAILPEQHFEASVLFTKYLVLYLLIYRLVRTPEQFRLFLAVHLAGCFYLGWLGFMADESGRLEGVGGPGIDEANALAMHIGTGLMLGAMLMLTERKWAFGLCLLAMPFLLNTFVLAGSRGAFLALICGGVVLWFMRPMAYRRAFKVFAALAVILLLVLAHQLFWERMGTIEQAAVRSEEMDTSAESRFVLIEAQWKMAQSNPLGTGHRGTEALSPLFLEARFMSDAPGSPGQVGLRSSHNTFMTALVEQGIPGAILFLAMIWWCVVSLRRLKARWNQSPDRLSAYVAGIAAALTVVLVSGMFVDYLKIEVQIWLFALLASALQVPVAADEGVAASDRSRIRWPASARERPDHLPARQGHGLRGSRARADRSRIKG